MRSNEFISEAELVKQFPKGYYAVGDSNAARIGSSPNWQSFAHQGADSSSSLHQQALERIPSGSVVAISLGGDEAAKTSEDPAQIGLRINSLVQFAKNKGLQPVFVLFPRSAGETAQQSDILRAAIFKSVNAPMLDMQSAGTVADPATIAKQIENKFVLPGVSKPKTGYQPYTSKIKGNWPALKEPGFINALNKAASELGVNPRHLIAIMKQESGLDPQAVNRSSNATGLIQFMPKTAKSLGTSVGELHRMTAVQQLPWVVKYFKANGIRAGMDLGDLYMAVFYPAAVGKSNTYVLGRSGARGFSGAVYRQNKGLDADRDGSITVADVKRAVMRFA